MPPLVLGTLPPELEALLERRRQAGVDRLDEVWRGDHHMVSAPSYDHARITQQLAVLLDGPAHAVGLEPTMSEFNLGESEHDFRVPTEDFTAPERPASGSRRPRSSWRSSPQATRAGRSCRSTPPTTSTRS